MKLPSAWYAFLDSKEIKDKPLGITRFGESLVVWRDSSGQVNVFQDSCPHRLAKLSLGEIKDSCIVCPFHGFEYDSDGKCRYVPETKAAAVNLTVHKYQTVEQYGFIWIWWGEMQSTAELPWFDGLKEGFVYAGFEETWPVHFSRSVENQLDYAHLPFVHKNSIGGNTDPSANREFEMDETSIKVYMDKYKGSGYFEFKLGNVWQLVIGKNLRLTLAFVPVDENTTKLYQRTYQCFVKLPLLGKLICSLFNQTNKIILRQDYEVVTSQAQPKDDWKDEKLFPSDKAIMHFRNWLKSS